MKLYHYFYFILFKFSKAIKDTFPGSFFYNTSFDGILLLSILVFLNGVTLGIYLDIESISGSKNVDIFILGLSILSSNLGYFYYKERYKKIVEYFENTHPKWVDYWGILFLLYIVSTFYIFYVVFSG